MAVFKKIVKNSVEKSYSALSVEDKCTPFRIANGKYAVSGTSKNRSKDQPDIYNYIIQNCGVSAEALTKFMIKELEAQVDTRFTFIAFEFMTEELALIAAKALTKLFYKNAATIAQLKKYE